MNLPIVKLISEQTMYDSSGEKRQKKREMILILIDLGYQSVAMKISQNSHSLFKTPSLANAADQIFVLAY